MNKQRWIPILLAVVATGLVVASLRLPMWHMRLESPQYREAEALKINVYPGALTGDLKEIKLLNQYIGVRFPKHMPQVRYLPAALLIGGALGLLSLILARRSQRWVQLSAAIWLTLALGISAGMAQAQLYRFGHERNSHAALRKIRNFTPPLLGTTKIENFTVQSWLGPAAYLNGLAILLFLGAATWPRATARKGNQNSAQSIVRLEPASTKAG